MWTRVEHRLDFRLFLLHKYSLNGNSLFYIQYINSTYRCRIFN